MNRAMTETERILYQMEEERKGCRSTMIRMVIGFGVLTVTIVVVWLCLL